MSESTAEHTNIVVGTLWAVGCHSVSSCGGTCGRLSEVVPPVVVLEGEKAMTCLDCATVAFPLWSQSAPDSVRAKLAMSSTMFDAAVLTSDHKLRDTRTEKRTCYEASRRNTDNDLPSEQPISESRPRSAANAAVTAAFSAPQEVKFTSTVNSPVRLAPSDESGKDSVSLKMLGRLEMLPPKPDMERSATR